MGKSVEERFLGLLPKLVSHWEKCGGIEPSHQAVSDEIKNTNEQALELLFVRSKGFMNRYGKQSIKDWKEEGNQLLDEFLLSDTLFMSKHMSRDMKKALCEVSKSFLSDALDFDEDLPLEDIGQAMRNVWIILILQALLKQDYQYTKAIFGYSMLYPYTDNIIDDPKLSIEAKNQFNHHFYQRLVGKSIKPSTKHEEKVFALIVCIESVFPRDVYPDVYESLYLIMDGQIKSLSQQSHTLTKDQIMQISVMKGAASVVADGFLISGSLEDEALLQCMKYGFMLQLGDDLQDMKEDAVHHHQTLFSNTHMDELESLTKQLLVFSQNMFREDQIDSQLEKLICENCELLIYLSVAFQQDKFHDVFLNKCKQALPVHEAYLNKVLKQVNKSQDMNASKIRQLLMTFLS